MSDLTKVLPPSQQRAAEKRASFVPGIERASDPVTGPISTAPDVAVGVVDQFVRPPEGVPKNRAAKWISAYKRALEGECRNHENPTDCARERANAAVSLEEKMDKYSDYSENYAVERAFTDERREELADLGFAMRNGSFPIETCDDVRRAVAAIPVTTVDRSAVIAHIQKHATRLECPFNAVEERSYAWYLGYKERMDARRHANRADLAMAEKDGAYPIRRPGEIESMTWRSLPHEQQTAGAHAARQITERNYAQAVEDAQVLGWKVSINHYSPEEHIFTKPYHTDAGKIIVRAIMVRDADSMNWKLREMSQFATGSVAQLLPDGLIRHIKGSGDIAPILRGGAGSGHFGHAGRQGELGGSEPGKGSGGGSSGSSAKTKAPFLMGIRRMREIDSLMDSLREDLAAGDVADEDVILDEMRKLTKEYHQLQDQEEELLKKGDEKEAAGVAAVAEVSETTQLMDDAYDRAMEIEPAAEVSYGDKLKDMDISQIAREVSKAWGDKVNYAAAPYLDAMRQLGDISDKYWNDTGESVVAYFLSNASSFRGEEAREIKKELKARLKAARGR